MKPKISTTGFLLLLVFGTCRLASGQRDPANVCPATNTMVPASYQMEPFSNFQFTEAALNIFTQLRVPCDGYLTQWRFIARNSIVLGLHLGVFRPRLNAPAVVDLVAESYIDQLATPGNKVGTWVYYPVEPAVPVRRGDFLGYFYDRLDTNVDLLTIVSKSRYDLVQNVPPVAVFLKDSTDLFRNQTLDTRSAQREFRFPALTAVVTSLAGSDQGLVRPAAPIPQRPPPPPPVIPQQATQVIYVDEYVDDYVFETDEPTTTRRRPTAATTRTTTTTTTRAPRTTTTTTTEAPLPPPPAPTPEPAMPVVFTMPPPPPFVEPPMMLAATEAPFEPATMPSATFPNKPSRPVPGRCLNPPTALQSCEKLTLRGFFDYDRGLCRPFYGCESFSSEANNFPSTTDCRIMCEFMEPPSNWQNPALPATPAPFVPATQPPPQQFAIGSECLQPPSAATFCNEASTRYYFDGDRKVCYSFYGCGLVNSVGNNFANLMDCMQRCNASSAAPAQNPPPRPGQVGAFGGVAPAAPEPLPSYWSPEPLPTTPAAPLLVPIQPIQPVQMQQQPQLVFAPAQPQLYPAQRPEIVATSSQNWGVAPPVQQPTYVVQSQPVQPYYAPPPPAFYPQAPVPAPAQAAPAPFQGGIFNALPQLQNLRGVSAPVSGVAPVGAAPQNTFAAPSYPQPQQAPIYYAPQQDAQPQYYQPPAANVQYVQPRSALRGYPAAPAPAEPRSITGGLPSTFFSAIFGQRT